MNFHEIPTYDLYGLWYRPFWKSYWFLFFLISIATIVIALLFWYVYQKSIEWRDIHQPWRGVLRRLAKINVATFEDPARHKLFYAQLIDIIRAYFVRLYKLDLYGKTDQEMLQVLHTLNLDHDLYENICSIVLGAQAIKFASKMSVVEHMQDDLKRVEKIILTTITNK